MRHPLFCALVVLSLLALVLPVLPAAAQDNPTRMQMHEAVAQGKAEVTVERVNGYTSADVRIVNKTNETIEIEPTGSALIPTTTTAGKYTQRLATTTPHNFGPNDRIRILPGATWTGRLRTCCMDLGKPAPTTARPYTQVDPVNDTVRDAMRYWQEHPEITQDAVNRVIWGMYQLTDLMSQLESGACPLRELSAPIPPRSNYPQDAVEWHEAHLEEMMEEAQEMLEQAERAARILEWTELLAGSGADPADADPEGILGLAGDGDAEGTDADSDADGDDDEPTDRLGRELKKVFAAAKAQFRPVVIFVYTDSSGDRYERIRDACLEFDDRVLHDKQVFEELKKFVRLKLDVSEVSMDMAREHGLHGRRAPQLMIFDYEGELRYRMQTDRPADALNKLTRVREICERMFKRAHD